jgi:hypothetical protein
LVFRSEDTDHDFIWIQVDFNSLKKGHVFRLWDKDDEGDLVPDHVNPSTGNHDVAVAIEDAVEGRIECLSVDLNMPRLLDLVNKPLVRRLRSHKKTFELTGSPAIERVVVHHDSKRTYKIIVRGIVEEGASEVAFRSTGLQWHATREQALKLFRENDLEVANRIVPKENCDCPHAVCPGYVCPEHGKVEQLHSTNGVHCLLCGKGLRPEGVETDVVAVCQSHGEMEDPIFIQGVYRCPLCKKPIKWGPST